MRLASTFLVVALLLAPAAPVCATVLLPGDLTELAKGAGAIVRGRVTDLRTEWAEGRHRVETIVTLAVDEAFKGDLAGQVTFAVPGGVMGRYRSLMVGAPTFRVGDEVVLFLGVRPPSLPYVLGLGQGVFRILRDPRTGQTTVTPPAVLATAAQSGPITRGDPSRKTVSLAEFSTTLRGVLAGRTAKDPTDSRSVPRGGKGDR